jgi:hypothetical protein
MSGQEDLFTPHNQPYRVPRSPAEMRKFEEDTRKAIRERDIERMAPIAKELAEKAGPRGVIFADVRIVAVQRGLLTGEEAGRTLSYGPAVMKAAGLAGTGQYERSHIPKSHGNLQQRWVLPKYAEGAA